MNDTQDDPQLIQRRMASIRRELDEEVDTVVQQARELADWRNFVKTYPWLTMAGAVALGYLVVPQRLNVMSPDAATLEKLAKQNKLVVEPQPRAQKQGGLAGTVFSLVAGLAAKTLMNTATQQLNAILTSQASATRHPEKSGSMGTMRDEN